MHIRAFIWSYHPILRPLLRQSTSCRPLIPSLVSARYSFGAFFHTSLGNYVRDTNTYTKDKYDWTELEKEVFKDFDFGEKKPEFRKVTFIPEAEEDEHVVPKEEDIVPEEMKHLLPKKERMWSPPLMPRPRPIKRQPDGSVYGLGRRKRAVARVWMVEGTGQITINNRHWMYYFKDFHHRHHIIAPLLATEMLNKMDIIVRVHGGGVSGQAGAIRLGIARALLSYDPELYPPLKKGKFLTRDPREVERKKTGQRKARRKFQWVKR